MDISNVTKEQKSSAAVAWLSQNMDKAPESTKKPLERLNVVNNEGMMLVKQMQELKAQEASIDATIGQKIGGAKELFIIIADLLSDEQIDEFASQFDPKQFQPPVEPSVPNVDIAGATAPKSSIIGA